MANWKKVVVSGSNVSQLFNDAGYVTSATLATEAEKASVDVVANYTKRKTLHELCFKTKVWQFLEKK
jgi:hypothetical protein